MWRNPIKFAMQLLRLLFGVALILTAISCTNQSVKIVDAKTANQTMKVLRSGTDPAEMQYAPMRYTLLGMVKEPGQYVLDANKPTYVFDAIIRAGGFIVNSDDRTVRVVRQTEKGYRIITVKARNIFMGRPGGVDTELKNNDVIIVDWLYPENF